jgi:hypothetical protein
MSHKPLNLRGVQDGFGYVWPLLGKLGPRWAVSETNRLIGTGGLSNG